MQVERDILGQSNLSDFQIMAFFELCPDLLTLTAALISSEEKLVHSISIMRCQ